MRRWIVVVLVVVIAGCGGGGGSSSTGGGGAAAAFRATVDEAGKGQFGRLWESLHPAQKAKIDRATFESCYGDQVAGVDVEGVEIVETYEEKADVPGTDLKDVPSTAVTAKLTVSRAGQTASVTDTAHMFLVDGAWRWTMKHLADC